ncbi:hypothetical protein ACHWQZ_G010804 [Mnemiopsis leidyi]
MSSLEVKFSLDNDIAGDALTPGKCLLCQKVQPKSARGNEDPDKYFWVCCECRQIDSTDLLLGNDLKLGNIYDILGETHVAGSRYKSDEEYQAAQLMWVELRHTVRCIYRKAGTELAIDHMLDVEKMKSLVHKLCDRGPQQLYHQLETQGREYADEVKFHLLEHLLCHPSSIGIPQHAREFAQTLLDEYEQMLCATITLQSFLSELEDEHMARFGITWMLVNQHLFHQVVFSDPIIQKSLPGVCIQLKYGELQQASSTSKFESYSSVYYRLKAFEEEMIRIEQHWIKAIVSLASFVNSERLSSCDKDREEWEFLSSMQTRGRLVQNQRESDLNKDETPSSLVGHKKLFIKHTVPAPPIYPKTQLKAAGEVLKNVKVDKLASGSIEIKATRLEEDGCDCAACTTLLESLAGSTSPTQDLCHSRETSPLEKNWIHILNDIKDVGCDSSTQTFEDNQDMRTEEADLTTSERRLSTSSISSKDSDKPKYCACCYCELVGTPNPAQNSHNYEIFREKLRKKLEFKRNPEKARRELCAEHQNNFNLRVEVQKDCDFSSKQPVDSRSLEELVSFIEGKDGKDTKRRKKKSRTKDKEYSSDAKISGLLDKECSSDTNIFSILDKQYSSGTKMHGMMDVTSQLDLGTAADGNSCKIGSCLRSEIMNCHPGESLSFSYHLDKYNSLSKEQRALLLCGYRIEDSAMQQRQRQKIESLQLPHEIMERSNRNNMPNGKLMPTFPFLKTIDREAELSAAPLDKTDSEKQKEAIIVETLKKERPKQETFSKPKINVKEAYHGKNGGKSKPYISPVPPTKASSFDSKFSEKPEMKLFKQPGKDSRFDASPKRLIEKEEQKLKEDDIHGKKKRFKKKKKRNESLDDIFLPRCHAHEMEYLDESERELEAFKRFCMDTQPLKSRQKIQLNWRNVCMNVKKCN